MRAHFIVSATAVLSLAAATASAAPISGQISVDGYVEAYPAGGPISAATGLDFVQGASAGPSPGTAGGVTSFGAGTGSFAGIACSDTGGGCGSVMDIPSFIAPVSSGSGSGGAGAGKVVYVSISDFLTLTVGSAAIVFDLDSITSISRAMDPNGGSIILKATGTIHDTGLDDTSGTLALVADGTDVTSFSATIIATPPAPTPVPEPAPAGIFAAMLATLGLLRRGARRREGRALP